MVQPSIFKSYDIRGIYPSELKEETAYLIGQILVRYTGANKSVIGFDARLSSPALLRNIAQGMANEGASVYNIGSVPTECLYFAVGNYDFDIGVMITASHNPKEYNGFKMVKRIKNGIEIIRGRDLLLLVGESNFRKPDDGLIHSKDILNDYVKYILSFVKDKIDPFGVVVDVSNGVVGKVINRIKKALPIKIIDLNFKPDGNFPNHSPNPLEKDSTKQINRAVKERKADFGFIFDGDGDRVFLVDENGKLVPADITLLLLAKYFLKKNPKSAVAYNAICSKAVPEFIKKWGGAPVRTPVGFVNVREGLLSNNGIMGGELSGHYCFKDYFYMDSGIITFLILLQVISSDGRKVSKIAEELSPYFKSAEINFKIEDKEMVLEKIKQKYADGKQDYLDGVTVEYPNWWFNVRPSNTEPLLRLTVEADTQDLLEEKKKELENFIKKQLAKRKNKE